MNTARSIALLLVMVTTFAMVGVTGFSQSNGKAQRETSRQELAVGDVLSREQVHIITEPGRYGLGRKVGNSEYAVANGLLIRIEPKSMKVLSILRVQNGILD